MLTRANIPNIILALIVFAVAVLLFAGPGHSAAPPPSFSVPSFSAYEDAGTLQVPVTKSKKANSYSKVRVVTVDGSAHAGTDYQAVDTTLTFGNNVLTINVPVPVINRADYQPDRSFQIKLIAVRNAAVGSPGTISIQDRGSPPPVSDVCPNGTAKPPSGPCPEANAPPIADNFSIEDYTEYTWYGPPPAGSGLPPNRGGLAPVSPDSVGAFRFNCAAGQVAQFDPIVFPGQVKAGHLHQFWGNTSIQPDSNYSTMRVKGGSTCDNRSSGTVAINRTGYWAPAMLDGAGNVVLPDYINTYYKQVPHTDPGCGFPDATTTPPHIGICTDLPNGITFVFGWNPLTGKGGPNDPNSGDHWVMWYECWSDLIGSPSEVASARGQFHSIAQVVAAGCPAGDVLVSQGVMPQCWDGKNLDVPDHRSHLAFYGPDAPIRCPTDHPYQMVGAQFRLHYTTDANFVAGKWHYSCDMDGMEAGTCLHFDYMEAWSPAAKSRWFRNCIDGHLTAAQGDLCDRKQMKEAGAPPEGWPRHRLVPVPPM